MPQTYAPIWRCILKRHREGLRFFSCTPLGFPIAKIKKFVFPRIGQAIHVSVDSPSNFQQSRTADQAPLDFTGMCLQQSKGYWDINTLFYILLLDQSCLVGYLSTPRKCMEERSPGTLRLSRVNEASPGQRRNAVSRMSSWPAECDNQVSHISFGKTYHRMASIVDKVGAIYGGDETHQSHIRLMAYRWSACRR